MKEANTSVIINSVDRTIDVLEYLFSAGKGVSLTQISKDLSLYKSTVYRTLATLQNRGYVKQNLETGNYSLGIKVFLLGSQMKSEAEIDSLIKPYLEQLNREFHETVNLSVLERDSDGVYKSVIIDKVSSPHGLNANTSVGSLNECYCAAVGKCLLAFSRGVDLSIYEKYPMRQFTPSTITSIPALEAELEKVRRDHYAIDAEERERGLFCIGAPILRSGVAVAALSLSGPTSRVKDENLERKIAYVRDLGAEISKKLSI